MFWNCYRHGLLHQAAFKRIEIMPDSRFSGYDPRPVYFNASKNAFYLNPPAFFDCVKKTALADFATYPGSLSPDHKLPKEESPGTAVPHTTPTIGLPVTRRENDQP